MFWETFLKPNKKGWMQCSSRLKRPSGRRAFCNSDIKVGSVGTNGSVDDWEEYKVADAASVAYLEPDVALLSPRGAP